MTDERENTAWPKHGIVLGHRLTSAQLRSLFGKTSSEWTSENGKKHRVTAAWLGDNPALRVNDRAELMDLEIFWVGLGAQAFRNDAVSVIARLHLRNGRTFVGDGTLFVGGRGMLTVRGELVTPADHELISEIFGS